MEKTIFLLLLLSTLLFLVIKGQDEYDEVVTTCNTPKGATGECVNIHSCKSVVDFLQKIPKPISAENRKILLSYQCGTHRGTVQVCCSSQPLIDTVDNGGGGSGGVPDVTKHRNLRLLPATNCGVIQSDDRIINGNKTALFEYPWMTLLSYRTKKGLEFRCGGSLINERYILTAAHCVSNLKGITLVGVRLGEHNTKTNIDCEKPPEGSDGEEVCSDPVQDYPTEQVIVHPNYSSTVYVNDIALIRLTRAVNTAVDNVKPICLPTTQALNRVKLTKGIVTGWGQTESDARSNILLKVELPIVDNTECQRRYGIQVKLTDKQMCAGGKDGKDSCGGDSGGPLQLIQKVNKDVRYVQYGIVSFGPVPCARDERPGVYTKVVNYMDWILDNMKP